MLRNLIAIILLCMALASGAIYLGLQPTQLKLAIATSDDIDRAVFSAAAVSLRDRKSTVRLAIVIKPTPVDVASALAAGGADLGILRADVPAPPSAEAVLILRREAVVLVAPGAAGLESVEDLAGKRIAIVRHGSPAGSNLKAITDFYELPLQVSQESYISDKELPEALSQKRFDAYALVGSIASPAMAASVHAIALAGAGEVTFLNIGQAAAIAKRMPDIEEAEIPEGVFGGRPRLPGKAITTVAVPVRLIARSQLPEEAVTVLIQQIIAMRPVLSRIAPGAEAMETPDPDSSPMLVHAGARAFRDGEFKTFLDRYSDFIYLGLFVVGGVGSLMTAVSAQLERRRRQSVMRILVELQAAVDGLPRHPTDADLDLLERRVGEVYDVAVTLAARCELSADDIAAFTLGLAHARDRLEAVRLRAARRSADASA